MTITPAGFYLKEIDREWNGDMLRILEESPVEIKGLTICFNREPDIFAVPRLYSEHVKCVGFFKGDELVGFAMLMFQNRYVNGEPRIVMYCGNVHVKEAGRHEGFVYRASDHLFEETYQQSDLGYAVVMKGNKAAERFIGRRKPEYPNLPYSKTISTLCAKNIWIMGRKKENKKYQIRHARLSDMDAVVALLREEFKKRLFAPVIDTAGFLENLVERSGRGLMDTYIAEKKGEIVGTCAAWDTGRLKQNRIVRYGLKLRWLKAFHSAAAGLFGFPHMPKEGETVRDVTISDYAVEGRNPEILEALLLRIYNEYQVKRYNLMIIGSCSHDPLLRATRKFPGNSILSSVVLFSKDASFLAEGKIDTSLPYVDLVML